MTRINVGIHPKELPDKLLLAEHREITRIPNAVKSGRAKVVNIPDKFTLGKGHVKFFYDKLLYLKHRYAELYLECIERGFNVQPKISSFDNVQSEYMRDYNESLADRQIVLDRIRSKGFLLKSKEVQHELGKT